jgi:hypothetical protein
MVAGCAPVPRQQFLERAKSSAQHPDLPGMFPAHQQETKKVYQDFSRQVLNDPQIMNAVYDDAVAANKAWSYDAIMNRNWSVKICKAGGWQISDQEKKAFVELFAQKLSGLKGRDCKSAYSNLDYIFSLFNPDEAANFTSLVQVTLQKGAADSSSRPPATRKVRYAAIVAFFAKAKESFSDAELGEIMYQMIDRRGKTEIDCATLARLLRLVNAIDPIYREYLFELWSLN